MLSTTAPDPTLTHSGRGFTFPEAKICDNVICPGGPRQEPHQPSEGGGSPERGFLPSFGGVERVSLSCSGAKTISWQHEADISWEVDIRFILDVF